MSKSLQPVDQMVPGANLPAYVQAVSSIPILSVERERELAEDLYFNDNLAGCAGAGHVPPALCGAHCPQLFRLWPG